MRSPAGVAGSGVDAEPGAAADGGPVVGFPEFSQPGPPLLSWVVRQQKGAAMFGLGMQEVLVLLMCGMFLIVPVGIVFLVLFLVRRQGDSRVAELEAENRRLRKQLDGKRG